MRPVLRRIAIYGGLTALVLGVVGLLFAELGAIWLSSAPGARSAEAADANAEDVAARLRGRVPLLMAAWGFALVAVGEVVMHFYRKRRAAATPATPAESQRQPDDAEKLLLELLAQAESQRATSGADTGTSGHGDKGPDGAKVPGPSESPHTS